MKLGKKLQGTLAVEIVLLIGIGALLYTMSADISSYFKLYELFGGFSATILTTFGIYKMRELT